MKNKEFVVEVDGECMSPIINNLDKILIELSNQYEIGDIVLIHSGGKYRLHRVVKIEKEKIITKGDNSYMCDKCGQAVYYGIAKKNITTGKTINRNVFSFFIAQLSYSNALQYRRYIKNNKKNIYILYKVGLKIMKLLKKLE